MRKLWRAILSSGFPDLRALVLLARNVKPVPTESIVESQTAVLEGNSRPATLR
jgi:hypothetical protein